ncbi:MAG: hypothetical protein GY913_32660 [Proteobacteria bacterium]|nr:hypothetical protein [Pseudomonadota bacterium]
MVRRLPPGGACVPVVPGQLIVADAFNDRLRTVDPGDGQVGTLTGGETGFQDGGVDEGLFEIPRGVVVDAWGNVFVADSLNNRIRVVAAD